MPAPVGPEMILRVGYAVLILMFSQLLALCVETPSAFLMPWTWTTLASYPVIGWMVRSMPSGGDDRICTEYEADEESGF